MDLLIELVTWVLKALFGDTEKTADMDDAARRREKSQRPRPVRTGSGAPSLEELLAEVRREADQKRREQAGQTYEPRPTPRVESAPQPVFQAEPEPTHGGSLERREIRSALENVQAPEPVTPTVEDLTVQSRVAPQVVASLSEREERAIAEPRDMSKPKKQRKKKVVPAQQAGQGAPVIPAGVAVAEMLQTIRKGSGEERRQIAQQGFVLNEIFGPCRCHKRFAPPRV